MSIFQTLFDVTIVKCLVTTKINVVDTLYAATAVSLNIVDHLACVTNQPNVSTAQVITLQTQSNAHNWRKRRKFSKSNMKTIYHFLMLVSNTSNFTQVKPMQTRHLQQIYTNWQQKHTDRRQLYRILKTTNNRENVHKKKVTFPHPGKSNSSHPWPALKQATLDMMKKDEEKKRKTNSKTTKRRKTTGIV